MLRNYVSKTYKAIKIDNNGVSIRKATNEFKIPFSTLLDGLKKGNICQPTLAKEYYFIHNKNRP